MDDPRFEARLLLAHVLGVDRLWIIAHDEQMLDPLKWAAFTKAIQRRGRREPLAYIRGTQEFYGLDFQVGPGILVPRPETELLVDAAILALKGSNRPHLLDIGTGSGCIAVACAVHLPNARVTAIDASRGPITIAGRNAVRHRVEDRVSCLVADAWQMDLPRTFEMIVSNPPYIPSEAIESLDPEVSDYEPREALDGGSDGLDFYRLIASRFAPALSPGGKLAVEVGAGQASAVASLFQAAGLIAIEVEKDLQGIERVVHACNLS